MKKNNIFLSVLGAMLVLGILCIVIGVALGGTLFSYQVETNTESTDDSVQNNQLSDSDAASLTGIDFDLSTNDITIKSGDHYSISGSGYFKSSVKNGVWCISSVKNYYKLHFLSHTYTIPYWNWFHSGDNTYKSVITLPADYTLDTANLRLSAGSVSCDTLNAKDCIIKVGAGSLSIGSLSSDTLNLKLGAGEAIIDQINITDDCTAKIGAGSLSLGKSSKESTINDLTAKIAMGQFDLISKLTGTENVLKCSTGEINATLKGNKSNYKFNTSAALADVSIDEGNSTSASEPSSHEEKYGDINVSCNLGDVNIDFN